MVTTPANIWDNFATRKNNSDALNWQDKSFPYFEELHALYDGEHLTYISYFLVTHELMTTLPFFKKTRSLCRRENSPWYGPLCKKSKNASAPSTQQTNMTDAYQSPSPIWAAQCESGLQFHFDEDAY
jgi:hypothetical protein